MNYEYKLKDDFSIKNGDVRFWIEQDSSIHAKIVNNSHQLKVDPEELTTEVAKLIGGKLIEMSDKVNQVLSGQKLDLKFNACIPVKSFDAQIYISEDLYICIKIFCYALREIGEPVRLIPEEAKLVGAKLVEMADKIEQFDEEAGVKS